MERVRTVISSRPARAVIGLALIALAAALISPAPVDAEERTLHVPGDQATIQDAVDAAGPGDLILVAPGTYEESVEVTSDKPGITIRGLDRNEVILDGGYEMGNAMTVRADDVALENMTATGYQGNGFYWTSVDGFAGRYLTTWNIGLYGIYSFDSVNGVFEHSYASGSGDASFYVGQCYPCDVLITDVIGEYSALGYSGTNSGGDLVIRDSLWQLNGSGILPNSLDSQANPPQRETTIVDNVIRDNGNLDTPATTLTGAAIGHGIGIAGGVGNVIEGNEITDNGKWGVVLFPMPDDNLYMPEDNVIRGNVVTGNGDDAPVNGADLAVAAGSGTGNCFEDNEFDSSRPPQIEDGYPCDGTGLNAVPGNGDEGVAGELAADFAQAQGGFIDRPSYQDMPAPDPQPTMPGVSPDDAGTAVTDDDEAVAAGPLPATGGGLTVAALAALGLALLGSAVLGSRRRRLTAGDG